jgi:outer membrane beta-barrel protein
MKWLTNPRVFSKRVSESYLSLTIKGLVVPALTVCTLVIAPVNPAHAEGEPTSFEATIERLENSSFNQGSLVLQTKLFQKAKSLNIFAGLGTADRKDFTDNVSFHGAVSYFFDETWGVELFRVTAMSVNDSTLAKEILEQTKFKSDAIKSFSQLSGQFLYSPIYGKWALSHATSIHFDGTFGLGAGYRFFDPSSKAGIKNGGAVFLESSFAMSHHLGALFSDSLKPASLVIEYHLRTWNEPRTTEVRVFESLIQGGISWTL